MAVLTDEQTMLRDAAADWAKDKSPVSALRRLRDSNAPLGYDPAAYKDMAEMGWAGIIIPEEYDGSAFGYLSLGVVLEELGRTLAPSPLISSALGFASVLLLGGSAAQKEAWLSKIASGKAVGALAIDEKPRHDPLQTALAAVADGDGFVLNGAKSFVIDGMAADVLVVAARTGGKAGEAEGISLFLVPADAAGVTRTKLSLADSRGAAKVVFADVKAGPEALIGQAGKGYDILEPALDRTRAGLAAEMLGTALGAFDMTIAYLKVRVQFGQTLGSFQALQHRAAEMFSELEITRSAVEAALQAIDAGSNDIRELASLAKVRANETLHLVSNEMIQMHGGIGVTDAHDAGFYLKRARAAEAAYGNAAYHRERFARLNGL